MKNFVSISSEEIRTSLLLIFAIFFQAVLEVLLYSTSILVLNKLHFCFLPEKFFPVVNYK